MEISHKRLIVRQIILEA